jgi:hypothetical protein
MATEAKQGSKRRRDPWRSPYRFTAEQVLRMVEHGILPEGGNVELWDGILYQMTKGELHNGITSAIADALRRVTPADYHVREEKSCSYSDDSLPEPDVAVCRGTKWSTMPKPPDLAKLALVVEVDHSTRRAEQDKRHRRYAEVGIPIYWQVGAEDRAVVAWRQPSGSGEAAAYTVEESYAPGDSIPILLDGVDLGLAAVADFFPPDPHE